jgi:hypothetical protein
VYVVELSLCTGAAAGSVDSACAPALLELQLTRKSPTGNATKVPKKV